VKKAAGLEGVTITTLRQVHGDRILEVSSPPPKEAGEGDALSTDQKGVFLGIKTADCLPVLIVDPSRRVCAAVHAGWRGTLAGIAGKAIVHLQMQYGSDPSDLRVALGPAIGRCCYEVGPEVITAFQNALGESVERHIDRQGEKGMIDLRGLNARQLAEAGVPETQIAQVGPCTVCAAVDFHSYRREGAKAGRQISFVGFAS
jgi:YfiH family protein